MIDALTGRDVVKINDTILTDLADDDTVVLEFPNALSTVKTGKNGNTIYAWNATGINVKVTMKLIHGSTDDKRLNSLLISYNNEPVTFLLLTGSFIKKVGDGAGGVSSITYSLSGGVFTKAVAAKENVAGDTTQAVAVYEMMFSNGARSIA